jgi:hypothetical protein
MLNYELAHKTIIEKFGRFPERNLILGRPNTPEEEIYLMNLSSRKSGDGLNEAANHEEGEWNLH